MKPIDPTFAATLDTPVVVIDLEIAQRNIERLQAACKAAGVGNRPHIKTHKSPVMARRQLAAGAIGVTCQKLGEAEAMAEAGMTDILISYNVVGAPKHARLRRLAERVALTVCCDNAVAADGYASAMKDARPGTPALGVLVECDTGRHRCGVTTPQAAIALAQHVASLPGLRFDGLLLYPPEGDLQSTQAFLDAYRSGCEQVSLAPGKVCTGGTPNSLKIGALGEDEYRAGTYVYNDRQMIAAGAATPDDCALLVYATVVSAPENGRVMVDAGSKTLTSDLSGFKDHGILVDYPGSRIVKLAEEHGFVDVFRCTSVPSIGEVVRILPNHACPVSNLCDSVLGVHPDGRTERLEIAARGLVA
ncbi:MAG: alanine racemase [Lautropia sp.]